MQFIGFHPVDGGRRVEIVKDECGQYAIRLSVNGEAKPIHAYFGVGLIGWIHAQERANHWAKGLRYDAQHVR